MRTLSRPAPSRSALTALGVLAAAAVAVAVLALSSATGVAGGSASPARGAVGEPMPGFRLPAADGRTLGPADFAGRVVLYEFWATWCTPCYAQVEVLKQLHPAARDRGVAFLAIASGEPESVVREHLAKAPYPWPVLFDPEDSLGAALDVLGLPTLVVAGPDGRIFWRATGLVDAETLERVFVEAANPARAAERAASR